MTTFTTNRNYPLLDGSEGALIAADILATKGAVEAIDADVQALVDGKSAVGHTHNAASVTGDAAHRFVSDASIAAWDAKQDALGFSAEDQAQKGVANGYAGLDTNALVPTNQLPSLADQGLPTVVSSFTNDSGYQTAAQVTSAVTAVVGAAPEALNTLVEIAAQLASDESAVSALITSVAGKADTSYVDAGLAGKVTSVAGKTDVVTLVKADVGLGSVDNTSDAAKPVSSAQAVAIASAVTTASADASSKASLAQANAIAVSTPSSHVGSGGAEHALAIAAGAAGFMSGADKTKLDGVSKDTSGGYAGLTLLKLNLRDAADTVTSWFTTNATAARTWLMPDKDGIVAMLSDITGTNSGTNTGDQDLSDKQDVLVSGTNLRTVNGQSLLGSSDLVISGGGSSNGMSDLALQQLGVI